MTVKEKIIALTKSLYPTGRAFKMPFGGFFEKLHNGIAVTEAQAWNDALSIMDSTLPDNPNFTADDAAIWEKRLGLITNVAIPLSDRELAIARKMNHPGAIKARQSAIYVQGQLQAAGFNVYVFPNKFSDGMGGYVAKTPFEIDPSFPVNSYEHDPLIEHGDIEHGGTETNKVANSIFSSVDDAFLIGANYIFTFFIGGTPLGTYANVSAIREAEFRQLILKLKPDQEVAFLFVHYV